MSAGYDGDSTTGDPDAQLDNQDNVVGGIVVKVNVAFIDSAVIYNRRRILPCVSILDGEYNQRDIAIGVPVVLGKNGVERVIELPLTEQEMAALAKSADLVREVFD